MPETIRGLTRLAKYSAVPNILGYCGSGNAYSFFSELEKTQSNRAYANAKKRLSTFKGLNVYTEFIAAKNGLGKFDDRVLEAYWLGNSLVAEITLDEMRELVGKKFVAKGLVGKQKAEQRAEKLVPGFKPTHSFHVLYITFFTRKVKPSIRNLGKCIVSWGKVLETGEKKLKVDAVVLAKKKGKFSLEKKKITVNRALVKKVKKGDIVSIHWGSAIEVLGKRAFKNLKKHTMSNIKAVNSARK